MQRPDCVKCSQFLVRDDFNRGAVYTLALSSDTTSVENKGGGNRVQAPSK